MPKTKNEDVEYITMEDLFVKTFCETEEQRLDRLQEAYQIRDKEDIDDLLSSDLSYKDKLTLLKREKERVTSLGDDMNVAEYRFKNTRYFINKMIEACNEIKNDLKMDIPLTIGGTVISSATFYQLCTFLEKHRFTELSLDQFAGFIFGGIFAPIVSLIYMYYVVKDVHTYKNYQKQIKSYNRRLGKNKRQ